MLILTSSSNFVTQNFVHHLPKKPGEIKLTFIPTAAEVEEGDLQWLKDDRQALVKAGFQVTDFTVTGKKKDEVETMLKSLVLFLFQAAMCFFFCKK